MARKPIYDGGTKNKIIEEGRKLFFKKGFDGTSIRDIVDVVGVEVGLFYYYFVSKEDLFYQTLDDFLNKEREQLDIIVEGAKADDEKIFERIYRWLLTRTTAFRKEYADSMHVTVRWAMREKVLSQLEPYMERVLDILVGRGANLSVSKTTAGVLLAHGVGSVILRQDGEWVEQNYDELKKVVHFITGWTDNGINH